MTIPRPRLTVRRLMILVALAGPAMSGLALLHRRHRYARAMKAYLEARLSHAAKIWGANPADEGFIKRWEYSIKMAVKWLIATDRPWLPFEADLPEPE